MLSSPTTWLDPWVLRSISLLIICIFVFLLTRLFRKWTDSLLPQTASQTGGPRLQQQARAYASLLNRIARAILWTIAVITALPLFGITVLPALVIVGIVGVAASFAARDFLRDLFAGFHIVFEDQYAVGDTIQSGNVTGRVESFSLRRTVLRDSSGALLTLANGDLRAVANLSRDWSQAFVDVPMSAATPLEQAVRLLESATAELRGDPAWAQSLVDGPRILGVQEYGPHGFTLRLQVRTVPTRQEEVCRELRRRIQLQFQRPLQPSRLASMPETVSDLRLADENPEF